MKLVTKKGQQSKTKSCQQKLCIVTAEAALVQGMNNKKPETIAKRLEQNNQTGTTTLPVPFIIFKTDLNA